MPCIFTNLPSYQSNPPAPARLTPSKRSQRIAERHEQINSFLESDRIVDYNDFLNNLKSKLHSDNWLYNVQYNKCFFYILGYSDVKVTLANSIVVKDDLSVSVTIGKTTLTDRDLVWILPQKKLTLWSQMENIWKTSGYAEREPHNIVPPAAACSSAPIRKRSRSSRSGSGGGRSDDGLHTDDVAHYTSSKESCSGKLRISSGSLVPETTTFTLEQELLMDLHELSDKIQNFYPAVTGREFTLSFQGDDGDKCEYIFTSASESRRNGEKHRSLCCNGCQAEIVGFRYKCVSCADYDLCSACEALGAHSHHIMMRIAKPIKFKQAQTLLQRWCDAMKAAGVASVEDITGEPAAAGGGVGGTSGGVKGASAAFVNAETTPSAKRAVPVESKDRKKKVDDQPKAKKRPSTSSTESRKRKASEAEERGSMPAAREPESTVKVEPEEYPSASNYYNTFMEIEPTVPSEEVKVEYPDPLDTEGIVKVEEPLDGAVNPFDPSPSAAGPSRAVDDTGPRPGTSQRDKEDSFQTFTHSAAKWS